jgi:hypothetical protein
MKKTAVVLLTLGVVWGLCSERDPLRVGTFNIEDFPKSDRQAELAFKTIDI